MIRIIVLILAMGISQASFAQDSEKAGADNATPKKAEQLRLDQLEQKYWSAKDDEFQVVQNRVYAKEKRFAATLHYGSLMNDNFADGTLTGLAGSYYFSEHWGIEANYLSAGGVDRTDAMQRIQRLGTMPDHSIMQSTATISAVWVPFYAKMSVMDRAIIYFDMAFGLGVGQTGYEIQREDLSGIAKSAPHVSLDATQFYYLNKNFAVRLDVKYQIFNQERMKYGLDTGDSEADREKLPTVQYQHLLMTLGLTYFF